MDEYRFTIDEHFEESIPSTRDREGLRRVMNEAYDSFGDAETSVLPYNAHIGKSLHQAHLPHGIDTLPFILRRLPVYYEHPAGDLRIGRVEVVEN